MEWHSQYLWSKTGVAPCQPEGQSAPLERADQPPGLIVLLPEDPMDILASFLNDNIRAENVSCSTKQPSALEGCKRPALHPAYFLLSHLQSISHAVSLQPKAYPLCIISKVPIGAGMGRTDLFAGDLTFQSRKKEKGRDTAAIVLWIPISAVKFSLRLTLRATTCIGRRGAGL